MGRPIKHDLTGLRFGKWTVVSRCLNSQYTGTRWLVRCDCGFVADRASNDLIKGNTTSCGCAFNITGATKKVWSTTLVKKDLAEVSRQLGHFPSSSELRALGKNDLALAASRRGGLQHIAKTMQQAQLPSSTLIGSIEEERTAEYLLKLDLRVKRQKPGESFDLLIEDKVRVDVKAAHYSEYQVKDSNACGFFFMLKSREHLGGQPHRHCDLFILCGLTQESKTAWRYFIPANQIKVHTVTLPKKPQNSKYFEYFENVNVLFRLITPYTED